MSSLHWTISFVKIHIVSMLISKYLDFDMSRLLNVFFKNYMVIIKTFHCFSLGSIELILKFILIPDYSHTFATSTKRCFDHYWELYLLCFCKEMLRILIISMIAWNNRNLGITHDDFRFLLWSHRFNCFERRSNKVLQKSKFLDLQYYLRQVN